MDELQIHLSAKDDVSKQLHDVLKLIAKLEAQLKDATTSASPRATNEIDDLNRELEVAYKVSKRLSGTINNLDHEIDQLGGSAKGTTRDMDKMGRSFDTAGRKSKGIAAGWGKMTGAFAAVTGAIAGTAGAFYFLSSAVNEARGARKAAAQTAAVMRSMGRTEAPKAINQMIDSLSQLSGIDDDELRSMTNILLTFGNVTGKTFEKANALALDVSVAFGKDLASSAVMVGKALNDPAKGLTALTRIGVQFTKQQTDQVKALTAVGDTAGAQKIILKELERQVGGSAAAQADAIAKAQVAWGNLQEAIGEVILSVGTGGQDVAESINQMTRWIKRNKDRIVGYLANIISATLRVGGAWLVAEAKTKTAIGGMVIAFGKLMSTYALLFPPIRLVSDQIIETGQGIYDSGVVAGRAADKAFELADSFQATAEQANRAQKQTDDLRAAMKKIKDKDVRLKFKATMTDVYDAVNKAWEYAQNPTGKGKGNGDRGKKDPVNDTAFPLGRGPALGPAGLAAAHAGYASALGGHSILSGVRSTGLGSSQSDHLRGRAMDIHGPRMGAYAQAVRAAGGYAAFHGDGSNRHLHVVPKTARTRETVHAGGDSYSASVVINGEARAFDVRTAVSKGLRDAARQKRERG